MGHRSAIEIEDMNAQEDLADMEHDCPQCGEPTFELHEGYCRECCDANQAALDKHNAQYDAWQAMTDAQRDAAIKRACR